MTKKNASLPCFHCGDDCPPRPLVEGEHSFCCSGCLTVYQLFSENGLETFYQLNNAPGASRKKSRDRDLSYLDNADVVDKLVDFSDDGIQVIQLFLPAIHCSSCVWLLENLYQLHPGVLRSKVNFTQRRARITFSEKDLSLRELAELLDSIGYEPSISLEGKTEGSTKDKIKLYQLGISGFAFGNIMLMALPEYFDMTDTTLQSFLPFFRMLMMALSFPVVFYSARDYFISAYKSLINKHINMDVPIALGISVLFLRSSYEVLAGTGSGYFDSLAGLVFFLLLGKFFQRKTYDSLSFERDYTSYFPLAVTVLTPKGETTKTLEKVIVGDILRIRNGELIPADAELLSEQTEINNQFVTGESRPIPKSVGDIIFAGGMQLGPSIQVRVKKTVDQSYLTSLWNDQVFEQDKAQRFQNLTDSISAYFTGVVLALTLLAGIFWYFYYPELAFPVITSILIVACPCALALSAPFTNGNILRLFGRNQFYVKNAETAESLGQIDTIIWDKTGTLTTSSKGLLSYEELSDYDEAILKSMARESQHPLSKKLYIQLSGNPVALNSIAEEPGKGLEGTYENNTYRIGSFDWVGSPKPFNSSGFGWSLNGEYKGFFAAETPFRPQLNTVLNQLKDLDQHLVSGDSKSVENDWKTEFPQFKKMAFEQKPKDKLKYVKALQDSKRIVVMIGDGLNDAGALQQANVGLSITEDVNGFSPACDGILDAKIFEKIPKLITLAKRGRSIIWTSFILSFAYNTIGMYFAITGQLSPVISAILMPISSISVVVFVTLSTRWQAKKLGLTT